MTWRAPFEKPGSSASVSAPPEPTAMETDGGDDLGAGAVARDEDLVRDARV